MTQKLYHLSYLDPGNPRRKPGRPRTIPEREPTHPTSSWWAEAETRENFDRIVAERAALMRASRWPENLFGRGVEYVMTGGHWTGRPGGY